MSGIGKLHDDGHVPCNNSTWCTNDLPYYVHVARKDEEKKGKKKKIRRNTCFVGLAPAKSCNRANSQHPSSLCGHNKHKVAYTRMHMIFSAGVVALL